MFADVLSQLAVVAVFIQRVIKLVKPLYQKLPYQAKIDFALSLLFSAALCFAWGIDVFAVAGIDLGRAGDVLTGLVAALGSNILNDILALLEMWKKRGVPAG